MTFLSAANSFFMDRFVQVYFRHQYARATVEGKADLESAEKPNRFP